MPDHLNTLRFGQRLSLFGKVVEQEILRQKEIKMNINCEPPSVECLSDNFKPIYTENEAHLESIIGDSEDIVI